MPPDSLTSHILFLGWDDLPSSPPQCPLPLTSHSLKLVRPREAGYSPGPLSELSYLSLPAPAFPFNSVAFTSIVLSQPVQTSAKPHIHHLLAALPGHGLFKLVKLSSPPVFLSLLNILPSTQSCWKPGTIIQPSISP